jgi:hypothetical protein
LDEFRIAAKVFWVSYSAWMRACPNDHVDERLKRVSIDHCMDWYKKDDYQLVWRQQYSRVVDFYVNKVMEYTNKFMASPAGKLIEKEVETAKRRRSGKPLIDEGTLRAFNGAEGLNWTMADVSDFFQILSEVSETRKFETSVLLLMF